MMKTGEDNDGDDEDAMRQCGATEANEDAGESWVSSCATWHHAKCVGAWARGARLIVRALSAPPLSAVSTPFGTGLLGGTVFVEVLSIIPRSFTTDSGYDGLPHGG